MKRIIIFSLLIAAMLSLTACGGGGGSTPPASEPTKAALKLSTANAGNKIGGVDVTITLPAGVTVKSANPPEPDPGVVSASGQAVANSLVAGTYTAAASGSPATMRIVLVNSGANGFGTGEFATITCDLASGVKPASSDFTVVSATVSDITPAAIPGASVTLGVTLE